MNRNFVVAITGASGAAYAARLIEVLLSAGHGVHLTISEAATIVLREELDVIVDLERFEPAMLHLDTAASAQLRFYRPNDLAAPIASGSFSTDGMVVCPCSVGTLAAIAQGAGRNLIHRAADVHLKERRQLILVPRETPLSLIHLRNMQAAAEAGAVLLPAMPGCYHRPQEIGDLVDFVVARVCDQLGVAATFARRWGSERG